MPLSRISITLPRDLVAAADRRARELDRSRSWVVAEAVRRYLGEPTPVVREPSSGQYGPSVDAAREVAEARRRHLLADLARTPAERLHDAEELLQLSWRVHGRRPRHQIIGFDSYEDFYEWKKARRAGA